MNGARFHSTLRAALERRDISHRDKVVFAILLDTADAAGYAWPAAATVAHRAGILERAARASMRKLRLTGLIVEIAPGGGSRAKKYRVAVTTPDDLSGVTPDETSPPTPDETSGHPCQNVPTPLTKRTVTPDETSPYRLNTVSSTVSKGARATAYPAAPDLLCEEHPAPAKPSRRRKSAQRTPTEAARRIYEAYPRKVARTAALPAIDSALAKLADRTDAQADPETWLLERVQRFAEAVATWPEADLRFIPYPATWFNQGRFDDDPATWFRTARSASDLSRCNADSTIKAALAKVQI